MTRLLLTITIAATLTAPVAAQETAPASDTETTSAATAADGPLVLELVAQSSVTGTIITVGDVAAVPEGHPIAEVELAPAPLPGHTRALTRDQIEVRLERQGYGRTAVALTGYPSVVVERGARRLTRTEVKQALAELVPLDVLIERLPPGRSLPLGELSYRLRGGLPQPLPETFTIGLDVLVAGRVADRLAIGLKLVQPEPTVLAGRGTNGSPTMTALTPAEPAAPAAAPAPTPTPVPAAPPKPTWEVKRGDIVQVTAISGRVRITFVGKARGSGGFGDVIMFEAQIGEQKKTVAARLVAPDRAVMEL